MVKSYNYNNPTKKWLDSFKLLTFTFPIQCQHKYYKKRKYSIVIFYEDMQKKIKSKKIYFGFRGKKNKIDDPNFRTKRQ